MQNLIFFWFSSQDFRPKACLNNISTTLQMSSIYFLPEFKFIMLQHIFKKIKNTKYFLMVELSRGLYSHEKTKLLFTKRAVQSMNLPGNIHF